METNRSCNERNTEQNIRERATSKQNTNAYLHFPVQCMGGCAMQPGEGNFSGIHIGNKKKYSIQEIQKREKQPTMSYMATALGCWGMCSSQGKNNMFCTEMQQTVTTF